MDAARLKHRQRARRKLGVRKRVFGTADRPRLTVSRSLKHISGQIIDDATGRTLVWAGTGDCDLRESVDKGGNVAAASKIGAVLSERARAKGIERVAFDRNGYKYHGRVKALAEAARKAGLEF
jgi:large subunit ribosomal protein L18